MHWAGQALWLCGKLNTARAVEQLRTYLALLACLDFQGSVVSVEGDAWIEEDAELDSEVGPRGVDEGIEEDAELDGEGDPLEGNEVAWQKTIKDAGNLADTEPEPEPELKPEERRINKRRRIPKETQHQVELEAGV